MNKKLNVLGVIALTMPLTALAGQVDSAKITTFTANTPAKAAEVNANFAEQTKQINDNQARIGALEVVGSSFGGHLLKPLSGLVSIGSQAITLAGTGTKFQSEVNVGDAIKVNNEIFTVASIVSDISLTLSAASLNGALDVQAFVDEDLLSVKKGDGSAQLTVDKSGDLGVQGNLNLQGSLTRGISVASGVDDHDGLDNGQLVSRVLSVVKKQDSTALRIGYVDNFRVTGNNQACTWTIKVDGQECPNGSLHYSKYFSANGDSIAPSKVSGYCAGLPAGQHEIQVWVRPTFALYVGSNCFTGWYTTWTLESEEVYIN